MKNNKIAIFLSVMIPALCLMLSCSDITETQQKYIGQAGRIYVGKIDSLKVLSGEGRVRILGSSLYARTAQYCIVSWEEDVEKSQRFEIEDILTGSGGISMDLDNIPEGSYYFSVQTFDANGNNSVIETCYGSSYGETLISGLVAKKAIKMDPQPEGLYLTWNKDDYAVSWEVTYESTTGEKTITVQAGEETTKITDWVLGGKMETLTTVLPYEDALDLVQPEAVVQYFPTEAYFGLNKTLILENLLPTDNDGHGFFWPGIPALFDGSTAPERGYHTWPQNDAPHQGVPNHFTIDLGVKARVNRMRVVGVSPASDWYPVKIQLWGIETLTPDNYTTLTSKDPGWDAESVSKGWTLLGEFTSRVAHDDTYTIAPENVTNVRYLRIRALQSLKNTPLDDYTCIGELFFWAEAITPLP